jgi:hypothetical protein
MEMLPPARLTLKEDTHETPKASQWKIEKNLKKLS